MSRFDVGEYVLVIGGRTGRVAVDCGEFVLVTVGDPLNEDAAAVCSLVAVNRELVEPVA